MAPVTPLAPKPPLLRTTKSIHVFFALMLRCSCSVCVPPVTPRLMLHVFAPLWEGQTVNVWLFLLRVCVAPVVPTVPKPPPLNKTKVCSPVNGAGCPIGPQAAPPENKKFIAHRLFFAPLCLALGAFAPLKLAPAPLQNN